MEHKKTMLDYIADCPEFIRNNVADSAALTKPLVDEYVNGGYKNIWIVACGSSSNGSLCARQFIRRHLKCEVKIVTPFHFETSPRFILYPARMISARRIWSLLSAKAATA